MAWSKRSHWALAGVGLVLAAGGAVAFGLDPDPTTMPTAGLDPGVVSLRTTTAQIDGRAMTVPAPFLDDVVLATATQIPSSSKYQILLADGRTPGEKCLSVWPQAALLDEVGRTEIFNTTLGSLAGCWNAESRAKAHLYAFSGPKGLSGVVYVPVEGAIVRVNGGPPQTVVGSTYEFAADVCQTVEVVTALPSGATESHSFTATPVPIRVGGAVPACK